MITLGDLKLKDKRVDRMLAKRQLPDADIYYSPIGLWIVYLLFILGSSIGIFLPVVVLDFYPFFLLLLAIGYLVAAALNTSFAITHDALIAVNPNFPFRKLKAYPVKDIQLVTFDKIKFNWQYAAGVFGSNFIEIQMPQQTRKHYCVGLEVEEFFGNETEKTIDDLYNTMKEMGIPTSFKLDG